MTFWRDLLLIAWKEFLHLRRDPYTLVLTVALPLIQFLLFGYALDTRVHDVPTAVQNLDGERFSRTLVDQFARSGVFRVTHRASSEQELLGMLRRGEVRVAVQIPSALFCKCVLSSALRRTRVDRRVGWRIVRAGCCCGAVHWPGAGRIHDRCRNTSRAAASSIAVRGTFQSSGAVGQLLRSGAGCQPGGDDHPAPGGSIAGKGARARHAGPVANYQHQPGRLDLGKITWLGPPWDLAPAAC